MSSNLWKNLPCPAFGAQNLRSRSRFTSSFASFSNVVKSCQQERISSNRNVEEGKEGWMLIEIKNKDSMSVFSSTDRIKGYMNVRRTYIYSVRLFLSLLVDYRWMRCVTSKFSTRKYVLWRCSESKWKNRMLSLFYRHDNVDGIHPVSW